MGKITLLFIAIIFSVNCFSQAPDWLWAQGAGSIPGYSDYPYRITTDYSSNVYIAGGFASPTLNFGVTTLINAGAIDIFIAKYSDGGNLLWAKQAGGTGLDRAWDICTDGMGNIYITGEFEDTLTLDSISLISLGYSDVFVAKYDSSGNVLWAKKGGGPSDYDYSYAITCDVNNNVYITGRCTSGPITFETVTSPSGGLLIVKYNSSGSLVWLKSGLSPKGRSIVTDANENVYITGDFKGTAIIGMDTLISPGSNENLFIAKFDSLGNAVWGEAAGGVHIEYSNAISIHGAHLYITGEFSSSSITFGTTTLNNAYSLGNRADVFVAKYDTSGNSFWAKKAGGVYHDWVGGTGIAIDSSENIFISGGFAYPSITFGTYTLYNNAFPSTPDPHPDIFVVKYDSSGTVLWATAVGETSSDDIAIGIALNGSNNVYITGSFNNPSITFGAITLNGTGYHNIFTAKLDTLSIPTGNILGNYFDNLFSVYPNPTTNELTIENTELKIKEIEIYSSLGEKVFSQLQTSNFKLQTVDVSQLPPGIYFITITDQAGNKVTKKVVKM